ELALRGDDQALRGVERGRRAAAVRDDAGSRVASPPARHDLRRRAADPGGRRAAARVLPDGRRPQPVRDAGLLVVRLGSVHHDADGLGARVVGRRRHMDRQPLGVTPLLLRLLRALLDARPGVRLLKMGGPEMAPSLFKRRGLRPPRTPPANARSAPGNPWRSSILLPALANSSTVPSAYACELGSRTSPDDRRHRSAAARALVLGAARDVDQRI